MEHETWIIHEKFHFVWVCAPEKTAKNSKMKKDAE